MYFRYRGATKGAEQFCYGVIDADNVKRRKFYEVQSFFRDMIQVQDAEVLFHYADLEEKITKLLMEQVMRDWHSKALWSSSSSRERGTKRGFY